MSAVASLDRGRWGLAAGLLNLACATRYDSWLLVPLLAALEGWRTRSVARALLFGAAASLFAVAWLAGNQLARGDALFPVRYIDDFHRAWWPAEAALWGEGAYRLMCLLFWPGAALFTLGLVAFPAMGALRAAWREQPEVRWVVVLVVFPALLYAARGAVMASFAPLVRFTLKEVLLLVPFAGWWLSRQGARTRWGLVGALVTWSLFLTAFCWRPDSRWPFTFRAISPVTRMETALREPAEWLQTNATDGLLVLDEDPRAYDELIISYYSGRPFDEQLRRRWERFDEALGARPVRWLLLVEGGRMVRDGEVTVIDDAHVVYRGARFVERRPGRFRIFELEP